MFHSLRRDLQGGVLLPSLAVGLVMGVENAILAIAFAVMIFAGDLAPYAMTGITVLLLGSIILAVFTTLTSSFVGMASVVQDSPSAILATVIAAMLATMPQASAETRLYTALAAIILCTLLTGVICILL